ncbi:12142_t:CDS:1, partial [Dentiscutata heterogama]
MLRRSSGNRRNRHQRNMNMTPNLPNPPNINLAAVQLHADFSNGMPNLFESKAIDAQHQEQLNIATELFD